MNVSIFIPFSALKHVLLILFVCIQFVVGFMANVCLPFEISSGNHSMTLMLFSDTIRFAIDAVCDIFLPIFLLFSIPCRIHAVEILDVQSAYVCVCVCEHVFELCV